MAERSKAADCKSVVFILRRFESYPSHTYNIKYKKMIIFFNFLIIIFIINFQYDTYELYFNINSNLSTNIIYKISNNWSIVDNYLYFILLIIAFIIYNNYYILYNIKNILILLLFIFIVSYSMYINTKIYYLNNSIFNPLLTHFMVLIHPPIMITIIFYIRNKITMIQNINKSTIILIISILMGSYWANSLFGWGGWWSWDPIENIALINWLLFMLYIHKKNNNIINLIIIIDFLLLLAIKCNTLQSIHIFKIINLNLQNYFITLYLIIIILYLYNNILLYNNNKYINNKIIIKINILILCIYLLNIYFYSILYLYFIFITIIIYSILLKQQITNNKIINILMIFIISLIYKLYITLYIILTTTLVIILKNKKKNNLYFIHLLILLTIILLFDINYEILEIILENYNTYYNNNIVFEINQIDININHIEYTMKEIQKIYFSNQNYSIYNIFEKIETSIYNYLISNSFTNIKNNIIQIYKIYYLLIIIIILIMILIKS